MSAAGDVPAVVSDAVAARCAVVVVTPAEPPSAHVSARYVPRPTPAARWQTQPLLLPSDWLSQLMLSGHWVLTSSQLWETWPTFSDLQHINMSVAHTDSTGDTNTNSDSILAWLHC